MQQNHEFHVSTSKKSKGKNNRSTFLSSFMKVLSGGIGDKVIQAYATGNKEGFEKAWTAIGQKLAEKLVSK